MNNANNNTMKTLETIKETFSSLKEFGNRVIITSVHKYGIEKDNEISIWFSHHSKKKNFTITNLNTMKNKNYETETEFYRAIARLIKKQK